jgi:hypothetical protein
MRLKGYKNPFSQTQNFRCDQKERQEITGQIKGVRKVLTKSLKNPERVNGNLSQL